MTISRVGAIVFDYGLPALLIGLGGYLFGIIGILGVLVALYCINQHASSACGDS